ncbi:MAG: DUF885 family protein [Xanthomonadales bacterium]|nr:DUF885 family protein [Xanthomonadales bacterium]NIN59434.1 DUF885 family protein [Xanthomonadales bacterium]NIN74785.1 DUF885 family protein [Xanthomonadales bacterium]NIO14023.1 DUF885 family protein [Xanthomonadales bacterium]NIP11827.1 DUF885 family protein [Xanthomonadales bacterium]
MTKHLVYVALATTLLLSANGHAQGTDNFTPEWVQRSNEIAYRLLESQARFTPEFASQMGVDGFDEEVFDLGPNLYQRQMENYRANLAMLEGLLATEEDPRVRQDLQIMAKSVRDQMEESTVNYERVVPYGNLTGLVFAGFRALLDKQVPAERHAAALVRLGKYTGQAAGYEPLTELARQRLAERLRLPELIWPYVGEVSQDLERTPVMLAGLQQVFEGTALEGWERDLGLLIEQLTAFNEWVRQEILPGARASAVLPRELYELQLKNWGVEATPEDLMRTGQVAFMNIRNEMMALAPLVAAEHGYDSGDYREVLRRLKQEQLHGDELMARYREVIAELDIIIEREQLVSLPDEPARVRMATAAETAQQPSAHLDVPRLVGNTGEFPEFVVPAITPNEDGSWPHSDYAYPAMMWSLSAHEARPGHELQFTTMLRGGVSTARALFAFNSANVEGWALYAEAITKPHMPLAGQLNSLQYRLLRAARIWLDPMLNLGLTTPSEAKRILMEEVVEDDLNAQTEIDRYTFRSPGQATAYYYGYEHLMALRARTEMRLKDRFEARAFHDFVLAQGLLPPELLSQAVEEAFIKPQLESAP